MPVKTNQTIYQIFFPLIFSKKMPYKTIPHIIILSKIYTVLLIDDPNIRANPLKYVSQALKLKKISDMIPLYTNKFNNFFEI